MKKPSPRLLKLPHISPLTLSRRREPFDDPEWIFKLKHDGFRSIAYVSDKNCQLVSRSNNVFQRFMPLCTSLGQLRVKNAILDGELICIDGEGVSQFNQLMFRRGVPYFYAFDLLWLNGRDLRQLPLIQRKERLRSLILKANNPALLFADYIPEFGVDFFRMVCEKNLEGIVAKHRDSCYDRSARWIKIKNLDYAQSNDRHELFEKSPAYKKASVAATANRAAP
jgi:bifunctional non-homologous end joining protein LigD